MRMAMTTMMRMTDEHNKGAATAAEKWHILISLLRLSAHLLAEARTQRAQAQLEEMQ